MHIYRLHTVWVPLATFTNSLHTKQMEVYAPRVLHYPRCGFALPQQKVHRGLCFKHEVSFPKMSKKSHHVTWPRACRSTEEAGISATEHELSDRACGFSSFQITAFVCCRLKLPLLVPRTPHPKRHPPICYAQRKKREGRETPCSKHRFPAPLGPVMSHKCSN